MGPFLLALAVCILDQACKWWAVRWLLPHGPLDLGPLRLIYSQNQGGWGGLGSGLSSHWHTFWLIGLPALVLLWAGHNLFKAPAQLSRASVGWALVLGGGLSNLLDRVVRGYVVDYAYIGYGGIGTNIFNLADTLLLIGLFLVVLAPSESEPTH
jgi:signal peptidase II